MTTVLISDANIQASESSPVRASKLQHIHKFTCHFDLDPAGRTRRRQIATRGKIGTTAGWATPAADNLPYVGTLPASQTGSTFIIPLDGLEIGDVITGFKIIAQIESAGGAVTLDAELRATTNVAAEPTDAIIGTAMTQIAVIADTAAAQEKTGLTEIVTSGKSYYLKLTGTTAAATDIILQHCEITTLDGIVSRDVVLLVADKAGTLESVGAGCDETGSNTAISFDIMKRPSTSMLATTIDITHGTTDRAEQAGSISGGTYAVGDVIFARMTMTTAIGARGPWLRATFLDAGVP